MQLISSFLDLLNRQIIPSILMICFSFMLVSAVFRSSSRIANSINEQNRHKRDVRLAVNCLFMNAIFILLQTSTSVAYFMPDLFSNEVLFLLTSNILYLSYGIHFYIIFACNSLFRNEFFKILGSKI
jgi:uncharacterized membrane protein (DUF4010 family)